MGWEDAPIVQAAPEVAPWEAAPVVREGAYAPGAGVREDMNALLAGRPAPKVSSLAEAFETGVEMSVPGLAYRMKMPDKRLAEDSTWLQHRAAEVGQLVGDLPVMIYGGALGGGMGLELGPGAIATGMAGAFALPAGLRSVYLNAIQNGEVKSASDFAGMAVDALHETAKGWITGALTGMAGARAATGVAATASPLVKTAAPTAAEIATMVAVGKAVEGELPAPEDFANAAVVIGGLKGSTHVIGKLYDIYERTGRKPVDVAADAAKDPKLKGELSDPGKEGPPAAYRKMEAAELARAAVPDSRLAAFVERPFADVPQEPGAPKVELNVNFNYINRPEDVPQVLARASELYGDKILEQTRGKVSNEQTEMEAAKRLAEMAGAKDYRLLLPREPGTTGGTIDMVLREQLMVAAAEEFASLSRRFDAATATLEQKAALLASAERVAMLSANFIGETAEAGRALQALQRMRNTRATAEQLKSMLDNYGKDPAQLAELGRTLENPREAARVAREAVKSGTWEKMVEAWKASILSGLAQINNIFGNTTFMMLRPPVDAVAAVIGRLTGKKDRVHAIEPLARVYGDLAGFKDGMDYALRVLKTGDTAELGKVEQYKKHIGGIVGEVVRLPFRGLAAADALFKTMNARGEMYSLAARQAAGEGLNPLTAEFGARVRELVDKPTDKMAKTAQEAADRFTFNKDLGEKGQAVQRLVREWHLQWAVPFIRTPARIAVELLRMTPVAPFLAEWRAAILKGGPEGNKAMAELLLGSGVMSTVFVFALDGRVTGAGDPDPNKRRVALAAGWQPYSIKVDGKYYSYQRFQPFGTLLGMAADVAEVWERMDEGESDKIPKMMAVAFANAITNQTFLQGITNVVNAMSDPSRFAPRLLESYAGSTVPAALADVAKMTDPVVREVNGMADAVRARVPGLRQELTPKRDIFGEPVKTKERMVGAAPVTVTTESTDKVRSEAARLGVSVSKTPDNIILPAAGDRKLGAVKLTPQQKDVYAETAGRAAYDILDRVVNQPSWDLMPDMLKKRAYESIFEQAHRLGKMAALPAEQRQDEAERISEEIGRRLAH